MGITDFCTSKYSKYISSFDGDVIITTSTTFDDIACSFHWPLKPIEIVTPRHTHLKT